MDNASFHRSPDVEQACARARVKLVFLPPYSHHCNHIEESFAELKAFIKKLWMVFEANPRFEFEAFLGWCVVEVEARKTSVCDHFHNAGVTIEERDDE